MLVAAIAVGGILVVWFIAIMVDALLDEHTFSKYSVYVVLASVALYFFIRFVRWAWETPIPFIER